MRGRDLDGSFLTDESRRETTTDRRRTLRDAKRCINGPLEDRPGRRNGIVHGPANPISGKCDRCEGIARRSRS